LGTENHGRFGMRAYTVDEFEILRKLAIESGVSACQKYFVKKDPKAVREFVYKNIPNYKRTISGRRKSIDTNTPHLIINGEVCYPKPPGKRHAAYMQGGENESF